MKKLYIAPDLEELRFHAAERLFANDDPSEYIESITNPEEEPF